MNEHNPLLYRLNEQLKSYQKQIDWLQVEDKHIREERANVAEQVGVVAVFEELQQLLTPGSINPILQQRLNELVGVKSTEWMYCWQQNEDTFSMYGDTLVFIVGMGAYALTPPQATFYIIRKSVVATKPNTLLFSKIDCSNKSEFTEAVSKFLFSEDESLEKATEAGNHPIFQRFHTFFDES